MKLGSFDTSMPAHRRKAAVILIMVALALPVVVLPWLQTTARQRKVVDLDLAAWYLNDQVVLLSDLEHGLVDVTRYGSVLALSAILLVIAGATLVLSPKS